jgi:hypothetical protein
VFNHEENGEEMTINMGCIKREDKKNKMATKTKIRS